MTTTKVVKQISKAELIRCVKKHKIVTLVVKDNAWGELNPSRRRELFSTGECYYWPTGTKKRYSCGSCFYNYGRLADTVERMYQYDLGHLVITEVLVGRNSVLKVKNDSSRV